MTLRPLSILAVVLLSCAGSVSAQTANYIAPHLLVYKTRANYRDKVPVTLSEDKKTIENLPSPADIKTGALPDKLHKGYLIDNRGISVQTAFLNMSYADYGKQKETPSIDVLKKSILVTDPFTIICDCGKRYQYKNPKAQVNKMIDNGTLLKRCKIIYQAQR